MGWDEPVYRDGVLVGSIRKHSDTCLIFILKARRPEKYRDRHEVDTKHSGVVKYECTWETGIEAPKEEA